MRTVELSKLAKGYDLLCQLNKDYRELLKFFSDTISCLNIPQNGNILDMASGTGNFTLEIIKKFPSAKVYSLEYNIDFLLYQYKKIQKCDNFILVNGDAQNTNFFNNTFDLVSLIHALNYIPDQSRTLRNIYNILRPNGYFVIADIGRYLNVKAKAKELILDSLKQNGFIKTMVYLWKVRKNAKENRIFAKNQLKGIYPMHTLSEFSFLLQNHSFKIEFQSDKYYGGLDDFIVAKKLVRE